MALSQVRTDLSTMWNVRMLKLESKRCHRHRDQDKTVNKTTHRCGHLALEEVVSDFCLTVVHLLDGVERLVVDVLHPVLLHQRCEHRLDGVHVI